MLRGLQSISPILMLHELLYMYMRLLDPENWLTTAVQISSTPTDHPFILRLFRGISSRAPASGSPLEGTPVPRMNPGSQNEPRFPATKYSGSGPQDRPFPPGKWKTSDRENLPYFRIWRSLTYSNRLRPALGDYS
ncbi:hypothetical protein F2Q69_00047181 [Brassica cretica]|uniref:Uncharacterized protein n=1 Tax=Brassica cretica TaxID=69181 RepID=A0A8S9PS22_BRACR|nr:hypothetical protein F2Q69_00047181 [Brassica cretica]